MSAAGGGRCGGRVVFHKFGFSFFGIRAVTMYGSTKGPVSRHGGCAGWGRGASQRQEGQNQDAEGGRREGVWFFMMSVFGF